MGITAMTIQYRTDRVQLRYSRIWDKVLRQDIAEYVLHDQELIFDGEVMTGLLVKIQPTDDLTVAQGLLTPR